MKRIFLLAVLLLVTLAPSLDATTIVGGSEKDTNVNARLFHTKKKKCPKSSSICGRWEYGSGLQPDKISQFRANYYKKSGWGSQASLRKKGGSLLRDRDSSTSVNSEAYASTDRVVTDYYYAYYKK